MVSQRNTLDTTRLIFVTVGTTHFPFDRLFDGMDSLVSSEACKKAKIIVQQGDTTYVWSDKKIEASQILSPPRFIDQLKKADWIVAHAGTGTLRHIAIHSPVMPLIIPRRQKYHEQVDDHQYYFARSISEKVPREYQENFCFQDDLQPAIETYITNPPRKNILTKNGYHGAFLPLVDDYIASIINKKTPA